MRAFKMIRSRVTITIRQNDALAQISVMESRFLIVRDRQCEHIALSAT